MAPPSSPSSTATTAVAAAASRRLLQKITFLGTSSGVPTPYRNVSNYNVTFSDGGLWMFDCGEGTQHRFQMPESTCSLGKLERIFVTHLHGDHCYGLPGLMCSLAMTWGKKASLKEKEEVKNENDDECDEGDEGEGGERELNRSELRFKPFLPHAEFLEIVGPEKLGDYIRGVLKASQAFFPFRYRVTELMKPSSVYEPKIKKLIADDAEYLHWCEGPPQFIQPNAATGVYKDFLTPEASNTLGITVSAAPLRHPVFCVGYALSEPQTPGSLNMEMVQKLGVPKGPLLSKLKNGESVTFPAPKPPAAAAATITTQGDDSSAPTVTTTTTSAAAPAAPTMITVTPDQVVSSPVPGRAILCLGDTCGSEECFKILPPPESGLLAAVVHEATFDDANGALAIPRGHSTSRMAGAFAAKVGAQRLILTHFSARFLPPSKDPEPVKILLKEAQEGAAGNAGTTVEAACDFSVFELSRKREK